MPVLIVTAYDSYRNDPRVSQAEGYVVKDFVHLHLFEHPGEIERLGQGGVEHVTNFSADRIAAKWQELFLLETT